MSRPLGVSLLSVALIAGCASTRASPGASSPPGTSASPTTAPAVTPSPSAAPPLTPDPLGGMAWQPLGTIASPEIREIVGFADGYVAVDSSLTVWFSPDGAAWQAVTLPFKVTKDSSGAKLEADVQAVATDGDRVLVVGGYAHEPCLHVQPGTVGGGPPCPFAPLAWVSDDGLTWTTAYPGPRPADPPGYDQGSEFVAAWPVPTGGWDAALSYWNGESLHGRDLMHAADGLTWTALEPAPTAVTGDSDPFPWLHAGVADRNGSRLLWQGWSDYTRPPFASGAGRPIVTLATSPDGRSWTSVDGFPGTDVEVGAGLAPTADPTSPWILAGASGLVDESTSTPTVWTSTDTSAWTATILPTAAGSPIRTVVSLVHASIGYVAVTSVWTGEQADQETWVSHDGVTWTALANPLSSGSVFGPGIVADGPAGIIGIGPDPSDSEHAVAVWQLH
jgi:hypothetical protein